MTLENVLNKMKKSLYEPEVYSLRTCRLGLTTFNQLLKNLFDHVYKILQ